MLNNITLENNNIIVKPTGPTITDERGSIKILLSGIECKSMILMDCKKGAIRANHWHKKDWHITIVSIGSLNYYERPIGSNEKPIKIKIEQGQMFYTKPQTMHLMEFLEDSSLTCLCALDRDQATYEEDTTKLNYDLRFV